MYKRKPSISIVISSNNDFKALQRCVESFLPLENKLKSWEFVIINNHSQNFAEQFKIQNYIDRLKFDDVVFYQAAQKTTASQMKNLGLHFARGNWIWFIDAHEYAGQKLIKFLSTFKFNINNDFYRISIDGKNKKKKNKIGIFKNKFYSTYSSSIIFNQEFIEKQNIKWENALHFNDMLVVLNKIYAITNVNYLYIRKQATIYRDFNYEINQHHDPEQLFDQTIRVYESLLRNKDIRFKQFIIILFHSYLENIKSNKEVYRRKLKEIKKYLKQAKIRHHNYFFIGFILYFKTIKMRLYSKV